MSRDHVPAARPYNGVPPNSPGDAALPLPGVPHEDLTPRDDQEAISRTPPADGVEQAPTTAQDAPRKPVAGYADGTPKPRPTSRPLPQAPPLAPVALRVDPNPPLYTEKAPWRWTPLVASLATLAWIVALTLLFTGDGALARRVESPRATLAVAWAIAAAITFLPIEFRLGLPGLAWQGLLGWTLLGYILAYVPPPTGWLLDLPDLPVYLLLFVALFFAIAAGTLPLTFLAGRRMYQRRMHRLDLRRARRQAYELGVLAVALTVLGGLRVLSLFTGLLLVAIFILIEMLLLSQVAPDG